MLRDWSESVGRYSKDVLPFSVTYTRLESTTTCLSRLWVSALYITQRNFGSSRILFMGTVQAANMHPEMGCRSFRNVCQCVLCSAWRIYQISHSTLVTSQVQAIDTSERVFFLISSNSLAHVVACFLLCCHLENKLSCIKILLSNSEAYYTIRGWITSARAPRACRFSYLGNGWTHCVEIGCVVILFGLPVHHLSSNAKVAGWF